MLNKMFIDFKKLKSSGYSIAQDLKSSTLGKYYFVFEENRISKGKDQALINVFDENGIPINRTYVDVEGQEIDSNGVFEKLKNIETVEMVDIMNAEENTFEIQSKEG